MSQWDAPYADIVGVIIEKTLLKIGVPVHDRVSGLLQARFITFSDCSRHPEILIEVLKLVFGDSYTSVINKIKRELRQYEEHPQVYKFVKEIK